MADRPTYSDALAALPLLTLRELEVIRAAANALMPERMRMTVRARTIDSQGDLAPPDNLDQLHQQRFEQMMQGVADYDKGLSDHKP